MTSLKDTFTPIRYYTQFDPYFYSVDNRPLSDLAANDLVLANAVDNINVNVFNILASTVPGSIGSNLIGQKRSATGATDSTLYDWVETQPLSAFEFMSDAEIADVQSGAPPTLDVIVALQTWVNALLATQKKGFLPRGDYKISAPLMLMRFNAGAYTYACVNIEGEKAAWDVNSGTYMRFSRLLPTFKNLPAIIIQNGRSVRIKDISCLGLNTFGIGTGLTPPLYPEIMTNSTFVTNGVRDSRYSPYAGVAIDPFGTSVPADGGYPGMSSYYVASAAGSSHVELESISMNNFVCGVVISPNGTTQNAEDIYFKNCRLNYNKTGLSICQSQSRNVTWNGGDTAFCLYGFDGNSYGVRQGFMPLINGCNMAGKFLFNVPSNFGEPSTATGIYAESFASIGFLGQNATSQTPTNFIGCAFNFSEGPNFPDHHLISFGPLNFYGCQFNVAVAGFTQPLRFQHAEGYGQLSFKGCTFGKHYQQELPLAIMATVNGVNHDNVVFDGCDFTGDTTTRSSFGVNSPLSHRLRCFSQANLNGAVILPGTDIRFTANGSNSLTYFSSGYDNAINLGSLALTIGINGTATFTAADGSIINTGDIIYNASATNYENIDATISYSSNWNAVGIVTNVVGNVITVSGTPQNLITGTYLLFCVWWPRFHQASTGDTHSKTTIDNVSNPTAWKIGNHIRGSGIPNGVHITNIVGSTFTISKATTSTLVGTRLFDADVYSVTGTAI